MRIQTMFASWRWSSARQTRLVTSFKSACDDMAQEKIEPFGSSGPPLGHMVCPFLERHNMNPEDYGSIGAPATA